MAENLLMGITPIMDWMREHYNQKMSYRYAVNPTTGAPFPLPVWSALATREMIVDHSEGDDE